MLDIKWIRENPEMLDTALAMRGADKQSRAVLDADEARRSVVQRLQDMQSRRNSASKEIGAAMGQKDFDKAEALKSEVSALKEEMQALEEESRTADATLTDLLATIPNIPYSDIPAGLTEDDNREERKVGQKPGWNHPVKEHFEIGEELGLMDFDAASAMSGARFTVLKGNLARLERALGQFMLDVHITEHEIDEINPPLLVRDEALFGTGQLPKFSEDLFRTTDGKWLIPTAEVSLTNLVREKILDQKQLPLRYTALTPCFRSEAGSAGRDTRGMLRQHQFMKCEMVSITDADSSAQELERMVGCAEAILQKLGLHYRVVTLCGGDMGFGARKTYDIEVWLPGQDAYREISSCSVCGDFQGRRMNARYRSDDGKATQFVHTLNGSGVAVGRCLIAVMENYLNEDGSITVPDALIPYMSGVTKIEKR